MKYHLYFDSQEKLLRINYYVHIQNLQMKIKIEQN